MNTAVNLHVEPNASHVFSDKVVKAWNALTEKVQKAAQKVFDFFVWLASVPARYIGSKTWSLPGLLLRLPCVAIKHLVHKNLPQTFTEELFGTGYHRFCAPTLTKDEARPLLKYAAAAAAVHSNSSEWIEPLGFKPIQPALFQELLKAQPDLEPREHCLFNPKTGLKIAIYQKEDHIIIAFGALTGGDHEASNEAHKKQLRRHLLTTAVTNLAGICPSLYNEADEAFSLIRSHFSIKGKKLTLTGQCLGGSIASYLSLKHETEGVAMNTLPLGVGLQYQLGQKKLMNADRYLQHISAKTDYLSDPPGCLSAMDLFVNLAGLKTPGNFGRKFHIPTAYSSLGGTHNYFLGSMMQHLGFDNRAKPKDIPELHQA